ncbi:MAG: IS4 family transposase [Duncaniella sp.]|nr:IS4 family transposase [Duncaniella sp.]
MKKYHGNKYVKHYSCWNHLLTMIWAQLTGRKSLRDIEFSLRAHSDKTYRLGIGKTVSRSTIAEANASREIAIFREMSEKMMRNVAKISIVRADLNEIFSGLSMAGLFAVDSSTVHLPLSKFPWSVPQRNGGGIKIHTMLDLLRNIPVTCMITGNEERDQTFMDDYNYAPGCLYLFDKAYVKTSSLYGIHRIKAFFVVRKKENMCFQIISSDTDASLRNPSVLSDSTICFTSRIARRGYPEPLRLICYYNKDKDEILSFMTNNFDMPAILVADAYRNRWIIEVFFKWVKQHLHIETFYGFSANAVSIQIYTAVITYCMVAKLADQFKLRCSNYELLRALGVSLTEKIYLDEWIKSFQARDISPGIEIWGKSLFD